MVLGSAVIDLNPLSPNDGTWNAYSVTGTAPAGTVAVRAFAEMVGGVDAMANPQSAMFDDFSLTQSGNDYTLRAFHKVETNFTSMATNLGIEFLAVPEPASILTLLGGLVSLMAWRRKR